MKAAHCGVGLLLLTALLGGSIACQQQPQPPAPPLGLAEDVLGAWNHVGNKLIEMAEDFPEDKYDYKPTPEVRSFGEHLLHVAEANHFFIRSARGEKSGEERSAEHPETKAGIVATLKKSFADGAATIQQEGDAGMSRSLKHPFANRTISQHALWVMAVENAGEHYGSLVVYYRLNGIVPPASRRRSH
jgi:uncharacterized damage-inducible protein DinB